MTRFSFFSILALALLALFSTGQAQQHQIGVIGGLNFDDVTGTDPEGDKIDVSTRTGFGIGGLLDLALSERVGLRFEPMFMEKGAKDEDDGEKITFKLRYLQLPLHLRLSGGNRNTRPFLMLGPAVGVKLSAKAIDKFNGQTIEADYDNIISSINLTLDAGAGLDIRLEQVTLFLEGYYALGISDIGQAGEVRVNGEPAEGTEDFEMKTRDFHVFVGFMIPLGGK
ncbi:MAG: PorT family protein [Calditrichaeota bacterium]|nr:MAG: PorT family protein [Calditrichota bacterium]